MGINRDKVLKKAQKQVRKRNWKKALRYYRELVDDDPDDMRSLLKCGDLHARLDRTDEAVQAYKSVADTYAQDERYQKAIAVYKQAKRLDDDDVAIAHAIGECHYRLGRLKDAIRTFHDVQRLYEERGDHDNQRAILEHMVRIDPDDVGLRIQLAERYTKDGYRDQALESFSWCADVLREEGRLDELVQVLERIVYLAPKQFDRRKELVRIYLDRSDNEEALKHLQICFRELSGDIETLEMLSQAFERLGRDEKAVMVLEELAPLYEKADRQADVDNLYRRILRLDPENETALEATGAADKGPDSGVLADRHETGPVSRNTPPPADDLDEVEFLDDDVEFLDDDVEFLDDDLVAEAEPANTPAPPPQANSAPPSNPGPPSTPKARRGPPQQPGGDEPEPLDLSSEVELLDDDIEEIEPVDNIEEIEPVDDIEEIEPVDDIEEIEPVDDIEEIEPVDDIEEIEPVDDIEEIEPVDDIGEIEPVEELEPVAPEAQVRQQLAECDVFMQYGLYDKAAAAIDDALQDYPDSVHAHQRLLELHQATGNTEQQCQALLKLAELHRSSPAEAYNFLQQALDVAADPLTVQIKAKALNIDLDGPAPESDEYTLEEVSAAPPQTDDQPETIHVEVDDDEPSPDDQDADDDPFGAALDGLDEGLNAAFESFGETPSESGQTAEPAAEPSPSPSDDFEMSDSDIEITEFDADFDVDDAGLSGIDTDSEIVSDDDLDFGDADDIVEMDLGDDTTDFDDSELEALDAETDAENQEGGEGVNELFDGVEADDLFDDLFGGGPAQDEAAIGGDEHSGELEEVDFLLQQGLTEEASEVLNKLEQQTPGHPGLDKRRHQLQQIRSGVAVDDNPFGAQSLSQKFNPEPLADDTSPGANSQPVDLEAVVNSNLELGISYREMGLIEEAIDEFEQAAEDPEAAGPAYYNIGLCQMDLGRDQTARNTFHQLLDMDEVADELRAAVREKLDELEARAS